MEFPLKRHLEKTRLCLGLKQKICQCSASSSWCLFQHRQSTSPVPRLLHSACFSDWWHLLSSLQLLYCLSTLIQSFMLGQTAHLALSGHHLFCFLTTSTARLQRTDFSLNSSLKPQHNGREYSLKLCTLPVIRIVKFPALKNALPLEIQILRTQTLHLQLFLFKFN